MDIKSLVETLEYAQKLIASGQSLNEARVRQSIVLPVLESLDWNTRDPQQVDPEYSVYSNGHVQGRVDFMLAGRYEPKVFVEVKRLGGLSDSAVNQAFGYAFYQGVPFLIITDGNTWDFYLAIGTGSHVERRFHHVDLKNSDDLRIHAEFLRDYLTRDAVDLQETRFNAEQILEQTKYRERTRNAIPSVWADLVNDQRSPLYSILEGKIEEMCGVRPNMDDVEAFLLGAVAHEMPTEPIHTTISEETNTPIIEEDDLTVESEIEPAGKALTFKRTPGPRMKMVGYTFMGESFEPGSAIDTLAMILKEFNNMDSEFMEEFARMTVGVKRRLVARNPNDLFDSEHLARYTTDLENGWWLGGNMSKEKILGHIKQACDIVRIGFGSDLTLIEREIIITTTT